MGAVTREAVVKTDVRGVNPVLCVARLRVVWRLLLFEKYVTCIFILVVKNHVTV